MTTTVARINTATGSRIEPPLDSQWSDLAKLQWKAAVVSLDVGSNVEVYASEFKDGEYGVAACGGSCGPQRFHDAWSFLDGVAFGYRIRSGA